MGTILTDEYSSSKFELKWDATLEKKIKGATFIGKDRKREEIFCNWKSHLPWHVA